MWQAEADTDLTLSSFWLPQQSGPIYVNPGELTLKYGNTLYWIAVNPQSQPVMVHQPQSGQQGVVLVPASVTTYEMSGTLGSVPSAAAYIPP